MTHPIETPEANKRKRCTSVSRVVLNRSGIVVFVAAIYGGDKPWINVGRYTSREAARSAIKHYQATGEKLPGFVAPKTIKPAPPLTAIQLRARVKELEEFVKCIRDGWDCDTGANGAHPFHCRCCNAKALLPKGEEE